MKSMIPQQTIEHKIFLIRRQKVMISTHLAELYRVETRVLIQAVKRNIEKFRYDVHFIKNRTANFDVSNYAIIKTLLSLKTERVYKLD